MLYEGTIRFAQVAREQLLDRNYEKAQAAFERVDAILGELHAGLRPESNPELCDRFAALYNFASRKLLEANFTHSIVPLDDALAILQHLRETWVMVLGAISHECAERAGVGQGSLAEQFIAV